MNGSVITVDNPSDILVLVNKTRALPSSYAPGDLVNASSAMPVRGTQRIRQSVLDPLTKMYQAMTAEGLKPEIVSAYRSYAEQQATFAHWVSQYGEAEASLISARAGHSEHQLGTTIDFGSPQTGFTLEEDFATTPEGRWLAANSRKYGFIMSYPQGKTSVTGYSYEPWHFRYVGTSVAQQFNVNETLEEYLRRTNQHP